MSASAAVERGESYLLERIRAHELVSRAPADSPDKRYDDCGEPFLALDAVIALADRITAVDRQNLAARLLRCRCNGAWDYTGRRGVDVDTTASAIRALDRLGRQVPLSGLGQFLNPRTGLFTTFARLADTFGLQFPPQTPQKHLGSHPCVLANVFLLLRERGRLTNINHELLMRLQKPDGSWSSYFYPSPFYSTRLYTELLTSLSEKYDRYMQLTLAGLLACTPADSPTQHAEILIALEHLRSRIPADQQAIAARAASIVEQILARQLEDGSWPGEVIWEFVDRIDPSVVVGFDHFRVRSTALCVRALKMWV